MKKRIIILLTLFMGLACSMQGGTVKDSFNGLPASGATSTTGQRLPDLPVSSLGGIGFSSTVGYIQNSGVIVTVTNDLSVALTNYVNGQSLDAKHWTLGNSFGSSGIRRFQNRPTIALSSNIWFSFLAKLNTPNGDIALVINATNWDNGSAATTGGGGLRVGLGAALMPGAIGVGPFGLPGNQGASLEVITNYVNGMISTNNLVPTNGVAGLVLGHIYIDSGTSKPRVDVWYNPDVPDVASLPTPTLTFIDTNVWPIIPLLVTNIGYQVNRDPSTVLANIDNVRLSDETNAFNIVYKNASLGTPTVNVTATNAIGTSVGPTYPIRTNIVFQISRDLTSGTLSVPYTLSGSAAAGTDYTNSDSAGSATFADGQTNVYITLYPIHTGVTNGDLSVGLTLQAGTGYFLGGSPAAFGTILAQDDAQVTLQYMFNSILTPNVFDTNLIATAANMSGFHGTGFSGVYYISPPSALSINGGSTTNSETAAVANGNYVGIVIGPKAGKAMTLTNLQFQAVYGNYLGQDDQAYSGGIAVRSSLDNFSSDLAQYTLYTDIVLANDYGIYYPWYSINLNLNNFTNLPGQVELRLYVYQDSTNVQAGVRIDNLYVSGNTFNASSGAVLVSVAATINNAVFPSTPGQFTITRTGDTSSSLSVSYSMGGTATNGTEYTLLPGTVTIPAGQSNVVLSVTPVDDGKPEPAKTVILSIINEINYGILTGGGSDTVNLGAHGPVSFSALYGFNEGGAGNSAGSLAAAAAATVATNVIGKVNISNASAGPGLGTFGGGGGANGHGYALTFYVSAPSELFIYGEFLTNNEADTVSLGKYVSFSLAPNSGYAITLNNFTAQVCGTGTAGNLYTLILRSSLDNYSTDLGSDAVTIQSPAGLSSVPYTAWPVSLNVSNNTSGVTYRLYAYGATPFSFDYIRIDDVAFNGIVATAPVLSPARMGGVSVASGNVSLNFTGDSSLAASAFTLQSSTNVAGPYLDLPGAVITGSGGAFNATIPVSSSPTEFFRIRY